MDALRKGNYEGPKGPVVLAIMDGVAVSPYEDGDAVKSANTPTLDWLKEHAIYSELKAHGTAVGMPSDGDMGNSEVGHNAIGCGRVFSQGASLVQDAVNSGRLFEGEIWKKLIQNVLDNHSALHLIGLLSDGNVHSHIDHVKGMLCTAAASGVKTARIHALLDGRDVGETSALEYVLPFEAWLAELNGKHDTDYRIASGGGRMVITMDRYNADWEMVRKGWQIHVKGEGDQFGSTEEAVLAARAAKPGIIDQDLPPFVIAENGKAIGPIQDNDSVIMFNFRGDRAMELTMAFEDDDFDHFDRGDRPDVEYAGMMQYDGDLHIPKQYLVEPPAIDRTIGEYLAATGLKQLAISETQKYGHVTYFFNGNRSGKFSESLEKYVEIKSDNLPFEQRPWMKGAEITDEVITAIENGDVDFIRINYPNGDMVGHTGNFLAVEISVETVDLCLARLLPVIEKAEGILVVSADHGNADDMYERNKDGSAKINPDTGRPKMKTCHSLNPVPVYIYDPSGRSKSRLSSHKNLGITSLTATCIKLLGYEPPAEYDPSIVEVG
jgi:2,3-bisphosphoglycerate-independent phosphoglycerate mutase